MGLVTLEDLLEELVGDIRDEYDEPESPASRS
jgi:CBS domain containing-hemolysin-like protein